MLNEVISTHKSYHHCQWSHIVIVYFPPHNLHTQVCKIDMTLLMKIEGFHNNKLPAYLEMVSSCFSSSLVEYYCYTFRNQL